ncbi:metallophosphoesterase [Paenibacillus sp. IITD108]|uniref:metallophosphoesterase n=1 Tax=Paenibacillus sp. IITD108 TaxID=3116649 RepID=UPI002F429E03
MDVSVGLSPVMLEDFENGLDKYMKTSGAAYNTVSAAAEMDQDYVRSGSYSLRLEYDFTGQTGTSGAFLTVNTGDHLQVPGYPEKISMWVHGDGRRHWLRSHFLDGDKKGFNVDLTDAETGVDWVGWKYIEADIPKGKKLPLTMDVPVRYMEANNNKKDAGVIYVDDIRVLYGPSDEDILPPVIKNIAPAEGAMVMDAHPDISFIAEDEGYDAATSPDSTLIDAKSIRVYVDGELVDYVLNPSQGRVTYKPAAPLAEGRHRIKAAVRDLSGNQTIKEWSFTVNLGSPYYSYTTPEKQLIGGTYTLDIHAEQVSALSGGHIEFAFDTSAVEGLQVICSEKLKEKQLHVVIDEQSGRVRLNFAGLQDVQLKDSDLLGQISYKIKRNYIGPLRLEDLEKDIKKPYSISVVSGSIEKTGAPGNSLTFYGEPVTSDVWADLKLSWNHYTIGLGYPAQFTITSVADGSKVEGAALIIDDVAVAGSYTNQEGVLVTDLATMQAKTYRIQAIKDHMYSPVMNFIVANPVFTEQPVNISVSMGEQPAESRRFNWHTHIDVKDTVVEYVKESEFTSFSAGNVQRSMGSNELYNSHSFGTYRVHRAEVTGLESGTAYKFRVGNGGDFVSAEGRFVTSEVSGDMTKFVFIGDSQGAAEKDYELWKDTLDNAIADLPDAEFIVHAGDMVDKGFLQQEWNWWFAAAQQHLMQRTLITAIGNHEVMGTNGAGDYLAHFNNPTNGASSVRGTSFSFDVKDTHFVLLNTELGAESYEEQAQWLDRDLKATDKKWKVLMFHQGPYGSVYSNERVQAQWVPILDKHGVDLVLNGHDHVYVRTYLMKGGAFSEKEGTRYVVGGSSGSKFYALVNRPWQELTFDQSRVNIYTTVEITKGEIKVTAKTAAGEIVDTLIIEK